MDLMSLERARKSPRPLSAILYFDGDYIVADDAFGGEIASVLHESGDASEAIQAAIDNTTLGRIFLRRGNEYKSEKYILKSTINIDAGHMIDSDGAYIDLQQLNDTAFSFRDILSGYDEYADLSGIRNLYVRGNTTNTNTLFAQVNQINRAFNIENIKHYDVNNVAKIIATSYDTLVRNINGTGGVGTWIEMIWDGSVGHEPVHTIIDACEVTSSHSYGVKLLHGADVVVRDSYLELTTGSVGIHTDDTRTQIHDTTISTGSGGVGMYLNGSYQRIHDCTLLLRDGCYGIHAVKTSVPVIIHDNYMYQVSGTPTYGIFSDATNYPQIHHNYIYNCATGIKFTTAQFGAITENQIIACTTPIDVGTISHNTVIINNPGFNPVGNFSAPAIPASGSARTNNYGYPCLVSVYGGTVSAIAIDGVSTGLTSGSFVVAPWETITITYSVAPTWVWYGI